jgi:hypothetical protein
MGILAGKLGQSGVAFTQVLHNLDLYYVREAIRCASISAAIYKSASATSYFVFRWK